MKYHGSNIQKIMNANYFHTSAFGFIINDLPYLSWLIRHTYELVNHAGNPSFGPTLFQRCGL